MKKQNPQIQLKIFVDKSVTTTVLFYCKSTVANMTVENWHLKRNLENVIYFAILILGIFWPNDTTVFRIMGI